MLQGSEDFQTHQEVTQWQVVLTVGGGDEASGGQSAGLYRRQDGGQRGFS